MVLVAVELLAQSLASASIVLLITACILSPIFRGSLKTLTALIV